MQPLSWCCCCLTLKTGTMVLAVLDIFSGIGCTLGWIGTLGSSHHTHATANLPAGAYYLSKVDYVLVVIVAAFALMAIRGVQRESSTVVYKYGMAKFVYSLSHVALNFLYIPFLPEICTSNVDAMIEEAQKRGGTLPPDFNRDEMIKMTIDISTISLIVLTLIGLAFNLYFSFVVHSCSKWMQRGLEPSGPSFQAVTGRVLYVDSSDAPPAGREPSAFPVTGSGREGGEEGGAVQMQELSGQRRPREQAAQPLLSSEAV